MLKGSKNVRCLRRWKHLMCPIYSISGNSELKCTLCRSQSTLVFNLPIFSKYFPIFSKKPTKSFPNWFAMGTFWSYFLSESIQNSSRRISHWKSRFQKMFPLNFFLDSVMTKMSKYDAMNFIWLNVRTLEPKPFYTLSWFMLAPNISIPDNIYNLQSN